MIIDPHNDISVAVQISRNLEDYEDYGESRIFRSLRMMVDNDLAAPIFPTSRSDQICSVIFRR